MEATTLLSREHDGLKELFDAYAAVGTDPDARQRAVRELASALRAHSRIEEAVFYPAVMRVRSPQARALVRQALEDHHGLDRMLSELEQTEPDDERFDVVVDALRQSVERHLESEEQALFAEARIHLTDERLERLGRDMAAARDEAARPALVGDPDA
jgi:hemerythrin-like domain-containing protein